MIAGGEKGLLRVFRVIFKGADASTFSCTPILLISASSGVPLPLNSSYLHASSSSSSSYSSASLPDPSPHFDLAQGLLQGVSNLYYSSSSGELVAVTTDNNFSCLNMYV